MAFNKLFALSAVAIITGCNGNGTSRKSGIEADLDSDSVLMDTSVYSKHTIEKEYIVLSPFTYITNLSSVNIAYKQGDYAISACGDSATLSHLQCHFDSNLLTVNIASDNNSDYNYFGTTTNVWLTVSAPQLECFSLCANGSFSTCGTVNAENLEIGVLGTGSVLLDSISCSELKIHSSDMGKIHFNHIQANDMSILSKADADINGDIEVKQLSIINKGKQRITLTGKAESIYVHDKDDSNLQLSLNK